MGHRFKRAQGTGLSGTGRGTGSRRLLAALAAALLMLVAFQPSAGAASSAGASTASGDSVFVTGRLLGPDGTPLAGWYIGPRDYSVNTYPWSLAATGSDGRFRFLAPSSEAIPIVLQSGGGKNETWSDVFWGLATEPLTFTQDTDIGEVRAPALRRITVRVSDMNGHPASRVNFGIQNYDLSRVAGWLGANAEFAPGIRQNMSGGPYSQWDLNSLPRVDADGYVTMSVPALQDDALLPIRGSVYQDGLNYPFRLDQATRTGANTYDVRVPRLRLPGADAPSKPTATVAGRSAKVSWTPPANDYGYPVNSYIVAASPGGRTISVPAGQNTTDFPDLQPGETYQFGVVALNAEGPSPSSERSDSVTVAAERPDAPTTPRTARGDRQVTVSWDAPNPNGLPITGYAVTALPGGATVLVSGDARDATITGLGNGTAYSFRVAARNFLGTGDASPSSDAITPAAPPGTPAQPRVYSSGPYVAVSWDAPADNGSPITGYTVTASPGGQQRTVGPEERSTLMSGLSVGTAYTFSVTASNSTGEGAASPPSRFLTAIAPPDAPTRPDVQAGDGQSTVAWEAPTYDGGSRITGYTVTASPSGATKTVGPDMRSATLTGLSNGTSYTFTVIATNEAGAGSTSPESDSVTPAGLPGRVAKPYISVRKGFVRLKWRPPVANGSPIREYRILVDGKKTIRVPGEARGGWREAKINLRPGQHTFVVRARNDVGTGSGSPRLRVRVR